MASIIFSDESALDQVNKLIHPLVKSEFLKWKNKHGESAYVIEEAAILFESGASEIMDLVITVTAPKKLRIARVIKRDGASEEQVEQRMANQINEDERIKRSDFAINNDEQEMLLPQIIKIHENIIQRANS